MRHLYWVSSELRYLVGALRRTGKEPFSGNSDQIPPECLCVEVSGTSVEEIEMCMTVMHSRF